MKKLIALIFILAFIINFSYAGSPPAVIQKAFELKFPKATKVSWGKENKSEWEAEFTLDGNKISANFALDGSWLETEREIPVSQLPKPVIEAINKSNPGWKITEADKTETAKNGLIYEAEIKSGFHKKVIAFKEDGTVVKE
ncbi:MAG TPA: PepSY-like domain-containing protein [Saprospiraceae bacterium]|nr:PepSY-like domain-containing protein [Saprospiraceae bacterium]